MSIQEIGESMTSNKIEQRKIVHVADLDQSVEIQIHTNPKFLELRLCCCYCCSFSLASVWSKVECLKLLKLIISDLIIFINSIQDARIFHFCSYSLIQYISYWIPLKYISSLFSFLFILKNKYQYVQNTPVIQLEYHCNSTPNSERQPRLVKIFIYIVYRLVSMLNTYLVIVYLLFFGSWFVFQTSINGNGFTLLCIIALKLIYA